MDDKLVRERPHTEWLDDITDWCGVVWNYLYYCEHGWVDVMGLKP